MKTVVLGVTSGIAAYKTLALIKLLKEKEIDVFVIMTHHATKMLSIDAFEKASGHKVYTQLFENKFDYKEILSKRKVDHIELADKADVFVIAPATANIIAKLAHGFADDFLTTTALATTAPTLLCPSMNVNMWKNPIVQGNVNILRTNGFYIIPPTSGMLACGYEGEGRLAHVEDIYNEIQNFFNYTSSLQGKKIIVTAGGTQEKIDDVRFITNKSSGKMGIAIAEECFLRGADVLLLRARNSVKPRYLIKEKEFSSADNLLNLIKEHTKDADVIFHTAAVSDFRVEPQEGKISSDRQISLTLHPQEKIVSQIKALNSQVKLIAFKAEYGLDEKVLVAKAKGKLHEYAADAIIANDVSKSDRGFESDMNEVFIVLKSGEVKKIPHNTKRNIAREIVETILAA